MDMIGPLTAEETRHQGVAPKALKKLDSGQVSKIGMRLIDVIVATEDLAQLVRVRLGDEAGDAIDDALELIVRSVDARITVGAPVNTTH